MNNVGRIIGVSSFIFMSILLVGFSIAIWKYKMLNLISGYNADKVIDKEGLAKWIGKNFLLMAVYNLSLLLIFFVEGEFMINVIAFGFTGILTIHVVIIYIGSRKFNKKQK